MAAFAHHRNRGQTETKGLRENDTPYFRSRRASHPSKIRNAILQETCAGPELDFWLASGDGHRLLLDVSGERRSNRKTSAAAKTEPTES